ncbi:MAG: hypothetical protein K0Q73_6960 [Paenibacillus sp.]|jgi:hypothetical protein|nr:hypothetical protein [Paenibacillus sp.]
MKDGLKKAYPKRGEIGSFGIHSLIGEINIISTNLNKVAP